MMRLISLWCISNKSNCCDKTACFQMFFSTGKLQTVRRMWNSPNTVDFRMLFNSNFVTDELWWDESCVGLKRRRRMRNVMKSKPKKRPCSTTERRWSHLIPTDNMNRFNWGMKCCSVVPLETREFFTKSHSHLRLGVFTLWRPLLPYGYSYKTSCARPG